MKLFNTKHDPMCIGTVAWGSCDCEMIQRIRDDERSKYPTFDEGFAAGYDKGRADAARSVKKRLKNFKKSFRKDLVRIARG